MKQHSNFCKAQGGHCQKGTTSPVAPQLQAAHKSCSPKSSLGTNGGARPEGYWRGESPLPKVAKLSNALACLLSRPFSVYSQVNRRSSENQPFKLKPEQPRAENKKKSAKDLTELNVPNPLTCFFFCSLIILMCRSPGGRSNQ